MDVWDYVNTQSQRAAAFLEAYARTSPVAQQAAEWYRAADQSGVLTVLKIAYTGYDLTNQFVDFGQHVIAALEPVSPDASYLPGIGDEFAYDPNLNVPVEQVEDRAGLVAEEAKEYLLAEGRVQMTAQEELRMQEEVALQDPAKLEAEKQDAARLEAQWEAARKEDEQAKQSHQQEAEQKVTDSLLEAVRKDQPQESEVRKLQEEQEKARADQADKMSELRDQLAEKYEGSPDQEKYLKQFDKAAEVASETLARQQEAEVQRLQEQQLQRQNPTDPSRDM
jgi:hypothetical protein